MSQTLRDRLTDPRPTISFEFMPPKTAADEERLWTTIRALEPLDPSFVSVTYGAGGSTRDHTIGVTEQIARETSLLPVAHLTAVDHSVTELSAIVARLADAGVTDLLALRGDPPGDVGGEWVKHPEGVEYASDLVELIVRGGDQSVGVAAFPYKHPRSESVESDTRWFVEKCHAGADYAITQMVFDAEDYLRLRDRVAAAGCDTPIIAGLMPVTTWGTVARSEQLSGAPFPPHLLSQYDAARDDPAALRALGITHAVELAQRLLDEGAPGLHFITMNFAKATREVLGQVSVPA
ncbi:methylenetetrahydrofolate reductase [Marmoricola endophyticus]|uniref:Methylenetetrahydrofolate reductase n=1 Tax=Marmoricola endophyticus TaxID=2040280 RepID=A0A917F2N2_9ACTN|nr:methylenetetrahydrofolate reductase [NAD(P)H] [Marmoricola endophyticus]GGF46951.1 methylenetetrahydrofolate reductase [Marmoricola endophyticus]